MPPKPLILSFDTSAAHVAAALLSGDEILAEFYEDRKKGQGEALLGVLSDLLASANKNYSDLDAIGVGIGPGNFTGIRISVAAARGLALGLGIPAIGVSTFDALRCGRKGVVVTSVAAPRGQVYLERDPYCDPILVDANLLNIPDNVPPKADPLIIGDRADEISAKVNWLWQPAKPMYPLGEAIARVAATRVGLTNLERPKPMYIRAPDAAPSKIAAPVIA